MSLKDTPLGHRAALTGKDADMARTVFDMAFAKVYPCLIAKAERKGRTREEVLFVTSWMTNWQRDGRLRRLREIEIDLWNSTDTGFLILRHITERISILPAHHQLGEI
ncbi:MAG: DUF2200 family protein [Bacteroidales bacterium]|nr:DUF2200 family protein [Bacteroidales bacterium]